MVKPPKKKHEPAKGSVILIRYKTGPLDALLKGPASGIWRSCFGEQFSWGDIRGLIREAAYYEIHEPDVTGEVV